MVRGVPLHAALAYVLLLGVEPLHVTSEDVAAPVCTQLIDGRMYPNTAFEVVSGHVLGVEYSVASALEAGGVKTPGVQDCCP